MPTPVQQKRIERLQAGFRLALAEYDRAVRWSVPDRIEAWATVVKLLDACICIEEAAPPFADASDIGVMDRLREIARDRDLLKADREPALPADREDRE
jgi:hypothetical protein